MRHIILTAILAVGGVCVCARGEEAAIGQDEVRIEAEDLSRQTKIYKSTLLGPNEEEIRVDAAIELLRSEDKQARQILLDVMTNASDMGGQVVVCKAITQSRNLEIRDTEQFIEPIFKLLATGSDQLAKAAAEASVGFDFKLAGERLSNMVADEQMPITARLNAIYALKLRTDKAAIFELIDLLKSKDLRISGSAELALQEILGIPVGTDRAVTSNPYCEMISHLTGMSISFRPAKLIKNPVFFTLRVPALRTWACLCSRLRPDSSCFPAF